MNTLSAAHRGYLTPLASPQDAEWNLLLAAVPAAERKSWEQDLRVVDVASGRLLIGTESALKDVYFPLTAVISVLHETPRGSSFELAVVGREGMVGIDCLFGADVSSSRAIVQQGGRVACVPARLVKAQVETSQATRRVLMEYARAVFAAAARSVVCSQCHTAEQRLCCRLLRILDRLLSSEWRESQEQMAEAVGVRRERVSEIASMLRRKGLIDYSRRRITVLDRAGIERHACDCYSKPKSNVTAQAAGWGVERLRTIGGTVNPPSGARPDLLVAAALRPSPDAARF